MEFLIHACVILSAASSGYRRTPFKATLQPAWGHQVSEAGEK